jgi:DNA-directed RNA polymerase I subunit RPA43
VGKVNKVGADFVGLLVMGVFNASVASADISDEFIHNPIDASPGGCWESAEDNGEHRIAVGSDVVFVVKAVSEHDDVLHMLGSLKETNTGEATRVLGAGYAVETIGNGDAYGDVGTGKQSPEVNDLTSVDGDAATPKKKGKGKNGTSSTAEKKAKSSEKKAKKEKREKKEKSAKKEKRDKKRKRED